MLRSVQLTEWAREYLEVGQRSAATITRELAGSLGGPAKVLDFGSGLGRTIRHLDSVGWHLFGCDVDKAAIFWSSSALPTAKHVVSETAATLPFATGCFDGAYAISVFTHFDRAAQTAWAGELARVVRPGGLIAISTMGPHALNNFVEIDGPACRQELAVHGFYFFPGGEAFNARGAFHTRDGLAGIFEPWFRLRSWNEAGLDGFQDLAVFERRTEATPRA